MSYCIDCCDFSVCLFVFVSFPDTFSRLLQCQQPATTGQSSSGRLVLSAPTSEVAMDAKPMSSSSSELSSQSSDKPLKSRQVFYTDRLYLLYGEL